MERIFTFEAWKFVFGFAVDNETEDKKLGVIFSKDIYPWHYVGLWVHLWWVTLWVYFRFGKGGM